MVVDCLFANRRTIFLDGIANDAKAAGSKPKPTILACRTNHAAPLQLRSPQSSA
jgi:hypothetical protein